MTKVNNLMEKSIIKSKGSSKLKIGSIPFLNDQITSVEYGLDPNELNRGQVIHFNGPNSVASHLVSNSYNDILVDNLNVEKKTVKNVVFCDWFEVTIELQNLIILDEEKDYIELSDGLFLELKIGKTKTYNRIWNVIYLGQHFGILMTDPSFPYMKPLFAQFKIENIFLYQSDWLDDVKHIFESIKCKYVSSTRIDIAIDGEAGSKAKNLAVRWDNGNTIGRKGKAIISQGKKRDKSIVRFHVGGVKSDKSATIYHKSDDIEKTGKIYISDAWKHNNLKSTEGVERFELRMKSKIGNNYDWERLDDVVYLSSIVRTECKNWFDFYYKGKDKNRYRTYKNRTMNWIDWDSIEGELLPKNKAVSVTGMGRAKRLIKDMTYMQYVEDRVVPAGLIEDIKKEYCLVKWYNEKIDYWLQEWDREMRHRNINSN